MDRLISWDCFLTNRMAAASAPHSRDSGPICTRVYPCVHSSDVCTLSAANTGHSCMQAEGKGGFNGTYRPVWGWNRGPPDARPGSVVFPLCGLRKLGKKSHFFMAHLREVFLPRAQMGDVPWGASRLLVIVPDHFRIPNYFNQSFSHMDSLRGSKSNLASPRSSRPPQVLIPSPFRSSAL